MSKVWLFGYIDTCWECSGGAHLYGPYASEELAYEALEIYLRSPRNSWDTTRDWRVFAEEIHSCPTPTKALIDLYRVDDD